MSGSGKGGKQTTLLQTWGYEGNPSQFSQSQKEKSPKNVPKKSTIEEEFQNDDFDALFAQMDADPPPDPIQRSALDPVDFEELPPVPETQPQEILPGMLDFSSFLF